MNGGNMTRKLILWALAIVVLIVVALWITSPSGTEFHFQKPTSNHVTDRAHWRLDGWHLKVTQQAHRVPARGGCPHTWEASAHTWAGSAWFHEIVTFDSRISWCGTGGTMRNPHVYITPDNARLLWSYEGVVGSSQGHTAALTVARTRNPSACSSSATSSTREPSRASASTPPRRSAGRSRGRVAA